MAEVINDTDYSSNVETISGRLLKRSLKALIFPYNFVKDNIYIKKAERKGKRKLWTPKVRTMRLGAEKELSTVVAEHGYNEHGRPNDDPRIDPRRRWMRESHVDELLQFPMIPIWLQIVGPRPRTKNDWDESIKEGIFTREYKEKVLESRYGAIPPDRCSSRKIETPKQYSAIHRLHTIRRKHGKTSAHWITKQYYKSNIPWAAQFLSNWANGQKSS